MEKYKTDRKNYTYIQEIGIILSLVCIIITVLIFPRFNIIVDEPKEYVEIVRLDDIPITVQDARQENKQKQKSIPPAAIFVPVDYEVYLDEVEVDEDELSVNDEQAGNYESTGRDDGPIAFSALPYLPRQIVEVIPAGIDDLEGSIKFSLLIDKEGKVKKHKILKNSLRNSKSIKNILDAVYKSKWMPINFDGESVEYWFEKTYTFNN